MAPFSGRGYPLGGAMVASATAISKQMMGERGVPVDHSTIYRWVQKYASEIKKRLRWH
ncbi:hypothetical protein ACVITL_006747 [Rhizobium pisi]